MAITSIMIFGSQSWVKSWFVAIKWEYNKSIDKFAVKVVANIVSKILWYFLARGGNINVEQVVGDIANSFVEGWRFHTASNIVLPIKRLSVV